MSEKKKTHRALPVVIICPVCRLPGTRHMRPNCSLMARLGMIGSMHKWADTRDASGKERSSMLREYHPEICPVCRIPLHECRKAKAKQAVKDHEKVEPVEGPLGPYIPALDVMVAIESIQCKPPAKDGDYTPVIPDWWHPGE